MSAPLMPQKPRSGSAIADIINSRWLGQLWDCVNYAIRFPKGDDCTIVRKGDRMFFIGRRSSSGSGGGGGDNDLFKGFKPSDTSDEFEQKIALESGYCKIGDTDILIPWAEYTITGESWLTVEITYESGYQITSPLIVKTETRPVSESGIYRAVVCHITWDDANFKIGEIIREKTVVEYEG